MRSFRWMRSGKTGIISIHIHERRFVGLFGEVQFTTVETNVGFENESNKLKYAILIFYKAKTRKLIEDKTTICHIHILDIAGENGGYGWMCECWKLEDHYSLQLNKYRAHTSFLDLQFYFISWICIIFHFGNYVDYFYLIYNSILESNPLWKTSAVNNGTFTILSKFDYKGKLSPRITLRWCGQQWIDIRLGINHLNSESGSECSMDQRSPGKISTRQDIQMFCHVLCTWCWLFLSKIWTRVDSERPLSDWPKFENCR